MALHFLAPKLKTAKTMEDVALNMRAPYFYPTSTQKYQTNKVNEHPEK